MLFMYLCAAFLGDSFGNFVSEKLIDRIAYSEARLTNGVNSA